MKTEKEIKEIINKKIKELEKGCKTCRSNYNYDKRRGCLQVWILCNVDKAKLQLLKGLKSEIEKEVQNEK